MLVRSSRSPPVPIPSQVAARFKEFFGEGALPQAAPEILLTPSTLHVGTATLARNTSGDADASALLGAHETLPGALKWSLAHVATCVERAWPVLLVGPPGSGKTSVLRHLAAMCGRQLREFSMTSSTDSTELQVCIVRTLLSLSPAPAQNAR